MDLLWIFGGIVALVAVVRVIGYFKGWKLDDGSEQPVLGCGLAKSYIFRSVKHE